MAKTVEEAVVRKSIRVQVPIERAFSVFVEQMEAWWPPAHHIGDKPFQSIFVEPRVGGRWFERDANGKECDWGTVRAWEPPRLDGPTVSSVGRRRLSRVRVVDTRRRLRLRIHDGSFVRLSLAASQTQM